MESHLISLFLSANDANHVKAFVNIARSFNDIASETILSDTSMVVLGFSIVFTYVIFMLGKFSLVESRVSQLIKRHRKKLMSTAIFFHRRYCQWQV